MNEDSSWTGLVRALTREIEPMPPGARIPTHRTLVARFGVSATTVSRALSELGRQGLIESRPGAGSFRSSARSVREELDTSWQQSALDLTPAVGAGGSARDIDAGALTATVTGYGPDVIDLNGGYLHPGLQPADALATALARAGRRPQAWARPDAAGLPELRDWFATDIGAGLARHDVLVTAGGQSALSLALRAIGRPDDPVVIEAPSYPGTLAAARAAGLRVIPVSLDGEGIRADDVERALTQTGARLVVVQPLWQNPTGATLSRERRRDLLDLAARHGAFVVEDDFARHMAHADAGPLPAPLVEDDRRGAVVHIRSLTKITSPNLRVAALAARGPVMARLRAAHVVETMFVPATLQYTALEVVTGAGFRRAQRTLAEALRRRRELATGALVRQLGDLDLPTRPTGGYHLWLALPGHESARAVATAALRHGVALTPGDNFYASASTAPHLRLSYVAVPSEADLLAGVERLAASRRA
ncbi:aminotransferase-like domain-containing protein [Piscicoccus intestinalis]|uniref:aminotransferase-like domain-containing protein n=1 Tax=Piscicoccus intestinalis TaxID=746033 RepID=UPI000837D9BE|nr:PLP-dependent aminotransferase family protein [Piscicoccus intestinalis]